MEEISVSKVRSSLILGRPTKPFYVSGSFCCPTLPNRLSGSMVAEEEWALLCCGGLWSRQMGRNFKKFSVSWGSDANMTHESPHRSQDIWGWWTLVLLPRKSGFQKTHLCWLLSCAKSGIIMTSTMEIGLRERVASSQGNLGTLVLLV